MRARLDVFSCEQGSMFSCEQGSMCCQRDLKVLSAGPEGWECGAAGCKFAKTNNCEEFPMACDRRAFIKKGLAAIAAVPVASTLEKVSGGSILKARYVEAQGLGALPENHPMASALGYMHDASKVDTAKFPKRAGEAGKSQFCSNCQLLVQRDMEVAGKEGKWGKCALFADGLVSHQGWCNSWVAKAS